MAPLYQKAKVTILIWACKVLYQLLEELFKKAVKNMSHKILNIQLALYYKTEIVLTVYSRVNDVESHMQQIGDEMHV